MAEKIKMFGLILLLGLFAGIFFRSVYVRFDNPKLTETQIFIKTFYWSYDADVE